MKRAIPLLCLCATWFACTDEGSEAGMTTEPTTTDAGADRVDAGDRADSEDPRIAFEILQVLSANEIVVWLNTDLTQEEFDAIDLPPQSWLKNQPREGEADNGAFARSPGASVDGEFVDEEHFGHAWRHVATITEANIPLDEQGLLRGNRISKFHQIIFDAGSRLSVIVSPEGEAFVRVSRDVGRTSDVPTIPGSWKAVEYVTQDDLSIQLPNPTINIRVDNEDSFQGPVTELDLDL